MKTISELNEQLKLLENTLAVVLGNSLDSIVVLGKDHKIICFNDTASRVIKENGSGIELEVGTDFRDHILKENSRLYNDSFDAALKGETIIRESYNEVNGRERWLRHKISPVLDQKQNITAITLASRLIDKEKYFERKFSTSQTRFQKIFSSVAHPILLVTENGTIRLCNPATTQIFGYASDELVEKPIRILLPEYDFILNHIANGPLDQIRKSVPCRGKRANGQSMELEIEISGIQDEEPLAIICIEDVTERADNQRKLAKFNHELSLLNFINDVILSASDENILLQQVCDTIVQKGGYRLAWFSLGTDIIDESGVIPVTCSAGHTEYVHGITLNLHSQELGPTGKSIRDGGTYITNNVNAAPYFKPWLERAQKFGVQSSIALSIQLSETTRGSLNIYSSKIDAFDPHEVEILRRIADNLSLAIRTRRIETEKESAQYELGERMKELRTVYNVNTILHEERRSIHEILARATNILSEGWQFPDDCVARIIFEGTEHRSDNYRPPLEIQRAVFRTQDNKTGTIEIGYTAIKPREEEGPFLKEERDLIDTLAEMIGVHYNERAAHSELRKSEANLKSVFKSTKVGHLLIDVHRKVIAFNHAMESGYARNTGMILKVNTDMLEHVLPERREKFLSNLQQVSETMKAFDFESRYDKSGQTQYYEVNLSPVRGANADLIGYCITAADITNRKLLELEREKIIKDLLERNKDLEQFTFMVSHNVRSPLAHILGLTSLLEYDLPQKDVKTAIEGIGSAAKKLDKVLKDTSEILSLKRSASEVKKYVSLSEIANETIAHLAPEIRQSGTIVTFDFPVVQEVLCIPSYIRSIFMNAVSNGIRYARPGVKPEIKIISSSANGYHTVIFQDNGIGLDLSRYGDKLFGLYQRFHMHIDGKGMGLFMIKTQIELMNGKVQAESSPGAGFRLTIHLPR